MSNSIYDLFKTDASKETKGIGVDYGEAGRFFIARAGGANKGFIKTVERLMRPYRRLIRGGDITKVPTEVLEGITREAFIENILLGWENVKDKNGNELSYNKDNAETLFKDLPDLLNDLQQVAGDHTSFLNEQVEEDAKN